MKTQFMPKLRWAALLSVALVYTALLSSTAFAAENGGIGGKPANPRADNPRTESIFVYELKPGESVKDGVQIFNNTEESKTIAVYATDAIVSSGGAFACAQAADEIKDVGKWISISKSTVTLAPGTNVVVPFSVTLPNDTQPGEHNGCIAIQEADAESANVGNGIALSFRSAIRMAITVPGEIKKELTIQNVSLLGKTDKLIGTISLKNNGNVSLDATVDTDLTGMFGGSQQKISGTYSALPQTVTELNFEYKQPYWGGFYKLQSKVSYNANTDESLGEGKATKTEEKSSTYIFVWPKASALFIELVIVVSVVLLAIVLWKKYILHPKLVKKYHDYTVKEGDNIQSIAKDNNVKWKHLAQINSIKAPYALMAGSVLKVPNKLDTQAENPKKTEVNKGKESDQVDIAAEKKPKQPPKAKKSTTTSTKKTSGTKKTTTKKKTTPKKKTTKKEK
jgi:LysM repeat protein